MKLSIRSVAKMNERKHSTVASQKNKKILQTTDRIASKYQHIFKKRETKHYLK